MYFSHQLLKEVMRLRKNYDMLREINDQIIELNIRIFKKDETV